MSAPKTERLLNLLIALLQRRHGYSKEELRSRLDDYRNAPSDEAFNRIFERDKESLRELGIPIETFTEDGFFDSDLQVTRYRVSREHYQLPELSFTGAEAAVLSVASRVWQEASLGSAAARAIGRMDLDAASEDGDQIIGLEPRIRASEPAFEDMLRAVMDRSQVSFGYRPAGAAGAQAGPAGQQRRVQPWGIGNRFGNWYVFGYDLDRKALRTFRLSRITTAVKASRAGYEVPAGFSTAAALESLSRTEAQLTAVLWLRPDRAHSLRNWATEAVPPEPAPGWDAVEVRFADIESFAAEIASFGPAVVVPDDGELRAAVLRRLEDARRLAAEPVPGYTLSEPAEPPRTKSSSTEQLARLLDLVAYVTRNPGADFSETAARFSISEKQLTKDLNLLFVCGTPGHLPDDLIEAEWESGRIYVSNADTIAPPVRLNLQEAGALLVGLQALATIPGLEDNPAIASALVKLTEAAGELGAVQNNIAARLDVPEAEQTLRTLRTAISDGRRVRMSYLPLRDELTHRTVEPLRILMVDGRAYLEAWCLRAEGLRNFRLDRIQSVEPTNEHFERKAPGHDFPADLFVPHESDQLVVIELGERIRGLAAQYNAQRTAELPDGRLIAELRLGSASWLPGLAARYGGDLRILAPAELRTAAAAWLAEAAGGYFRTG